MGFISQPESPWRRSIGRGEEAGNHLICGETEEADIVWSGEEATGVYDSCFHLLDSVNMKKNILIDSKKEMLNEGFWKG